MKPNETKGDRAKLREIKRMHEKPSGYSVGSSQNTEKSREASALESAMKAGAREHLKLQALRGPANPLPELGG